MSNPTACFVVIADGHAEPEDRMQSTHGPPRHENAYAVLTVPSERCITSTVCRLKPTSAAADSEERCRTCPPTLHRAVSILCSTTSYLYVGALRLP